MRTHLGVLARRLPAPTSAAIFHGAESEFLADFAVIGRTDHFIVSASGASSSVLDKACARF
jgi:hypothetical protein